VAKRRDRRPKRKAATSDYADAEGNVLTLRQELSRGTIRKLGEGPGSAAASVDDAWQRREEALFLGRYRMASADERRWVRETIARHVAEFIPELS
jgi:hypothetical protein